MFLYPSPEDAALPQVSPGFSAAVGCCTESFHTCSGGVEALFSDVEASFSCTDPLPSCHHVQ